MITLSLQLLTEIAETGGPEEWLRVYWPTSDCAAEPCMPGCDCGCEVEYYENETRVVVADAIRRALPAAVLAEITRDVAEAEARTRATLAGTLDRCAAARAA